MYEDYIKFKETPAGAVLKHILKKEKLPQKELAKSTGIYPQRINDLIKGKRKFTPKYSIKLEKALGINQTGFFCIIQTNFDVHNYQNEQDLKIKPDLSKINRVLFWDTPFEKINWVRNYKWVIQRTFENGNEKEIKEIIRFYGKEKVKEVLDKCDEKWWEHKRIENRKKVAI
jgi:plasmid maintenance system antidote protein VapI